MLTTIPSASYLNRGCKKKTALPTIPGADYVTIMEIASLIAPNLIYRCQFFNRGCQLCAQSHDCSTAYQSDKVSD